MMFSILYMTNLMERLQIARERFEPEPSVAAIAKYCKVSRDAVYQWLDGRTKDLKADHFRRLAEFLQVDRIWLETGNGPPPTKPTLALATNGASWDAIDMRTQLARTIVPYEVPEQLAWDDYEFVKRRAVKLSAGTGNLVYDESESGPPLAFTKDFMNRNGIVPDEAWIVGITGDSMEPFMFEGYKALIATNQFDVSRYNDRHWTERVFAIRHGDQIRVKCLQILTSGALRITSVNAVPYPAEDFTGDTDIGLSVIGRMVWYTK